MTPTDRHQINDLMSGFNGSLRVTPVTVSGTARKEVPGDGVDLQLFRRKTVMVQNTSSGTIFVGDSTVGYGASFGGGDWTTCSGARVESGDILALDAGRVRLYAFNGSASDLNIKILEIS